MISRRGFLTGLIAAPAIVHAGNLMPVKAVNWWGPPLWPLRPFYVEYVFHVAPETLTLLQQRYVRTQEQMKRCLYEGGNVDFHPC